MSIATLRLIAEELKSMLKEALNIQLSYNSEEYSIAY